MWFLKAVLHTAVRRISLSTLDFASPVAGSAITETKGKKRRSPAPEVGAEKTRYQEKIIRRGGLPRRVGLSRRFSAAEKHCFDSGFELWSGGETAYRVPPSRYPLPIGNRASGEAVSLPPL